MQGDAKLLEVLNQLLADELTAINQYIVQSEMCDNWGYQRLHQTIEHYAHEEMHHAHWLIRRIIFLDGAPIVSRLNPMQIGKTIPAMIHNDEQAELEAVRAYNVAIHLAHEVEDQITVELLTKILKMEEGHMDWADQQQEQIDQMGLENYLANQTEAVVS